MGHPCHLNHLDDFLLQILLLALLCLVHNIPGRNSGFWKASGLILSAATGFLALFDQSRVLWKTMLFVASFLGRGCRCLNNNKARNLSLSGNAHVHWWCLLCNGKVVYPMTAWRHARGANNARTENSDSQLPMPSTFSTEISDVWHVEFEASSFCEIPSDLPSALLAGRQYELGENGTHWTLIW